MSLIKNMWMRTAVFLATLLAPAVFSQAASKAALTEDAAVYTLANELVTAKVSKRSGDLVSLKYKGIETLGGGSGHPFAYWSHAPNRSAKLVNAVTIDPAANDGWRAEVSVKGIYQGTPLGGGPGGSVAANIEIRYSLGRDDSGIYTYSIFEHTAEHPATSIGEARFGAKLNGKVFDWMTIDAKRNRLSPTPEDWDKGTQLNMKEARRLNTGIYKGQVEHKYDYSAIQFEIPAFGWSSTKEKIGLWIVNPTIEYLSGGATKVELTGHLDNNAGAAPTVLNYWRGSHYGGSSCVITQGEAWSKVIGPFLIYCNSADDPQAMWQDALKQARKEAAAWPYDWVNGVDYPKQNERGTVTGQIVLKDSQNASARMGNLLVGLAAPDYTVQGRRGTMTVDWQQEAKFYQFWVRGNADGTFAIPDVRPGRYTLHAIADGVLGEYAKTDVVVAAGGTVSLGELAWQPARHGKQIWEIGVANRSAEEFLHGDHYWQWGLYNEYPKDFPNDVNFVIGKSDFKKDWNYAQVPRADRPEGTPWNVIFDLKEPLNGKATLRLGLAATSARTIKVAVNGQLAGEVGPLMDTATIRRDGIRGYWAEKAVTFDAALLKAGENKMTLTIPPGGVMSGVSYDYVRLEVAEQK